MPSDTLTFEEATSPDTLSWDDVATVAPKLPAAKLPPSVADEPLRAPSEQPYLPPLALPATQEEFAKRFAEDNTPMSQRPAITVLGAPDDTFIQGGGLPRIPVLGKEGSKLRSASEFAQAAQESLAHGIEGMTTPEASRAMPLFAIPIVGPALAAVLGTKLVSGGMGKVVTGAELHDPKLAGEGFGEVVVGSPLLARAGLPRDLPVRPTEASRVAAARNITPRANALLTQPPPAPRTPPPALIAPRPPVTPPVPAPVTPAAPAPTDEPAAVNRRIEQALQQRADRVEATLPLIQQRNRLVQELPNHAEGTNGRARVQRQIDDIDRQVDEILNAPEETAPATETPAEAAEMTRVRAMPEGAEGEAQLVAEDIAKAVADIDVSDLAGSSPVPALVRLIRRAARDPAMKTAAEQAMQKVGAAAREQGVTQAVQNQLAAELQAVYGADAPEMARYYFGEEKAEPSVERGVARPGRVGPAPYKNKGVGSPADEFGAIYGPTLTPDMQTRFADQVGEAFELPSESGTTTTVKVKPHMLWVETNRRVPGPVNQYETGVAYMHIRANGETVLDASKHGRPIDKQAADALLSFLSKTQGERRAKATPPAALPAEEQAAAPEMPAARAEEAPAAQAAAFKWDAWWQGIVDRTGANSPARRNAEYWRRQHQEALAKDPNAPAVIQDPATQAYSVFTPKPGAELSVEPVSAKEYSRRFLERPAQPAEPAPAEAPAPTAPASPVADPRLSPQDKGISPSEKAFRATATGQKAMASRASRIATLHQLNEAIRRANPDEAYPRNILDTVPDSGIDAMLEDLRVTYNRVAAKKPTPAAPTPPAAAQAKAQALQADIDAYAALRDRFKELSAKGDIDSPEFQAVFKQIEDLKNKYGGMPPGSPPPAGASPSPFFPRRSEAQGLGEQATAPTVEDVRRQRLLDREGTPVPPSPSDPTPPPAEPPAAELSAPDEPAITNAIRRQDVMPGRDWLASPEFEFRKDPVAGPLVTRIVEAELGYQAQVSRDLERFRNLARGLTKPQREAITSALRAAQAGNRAPLDALSAPHRAVADDIRAYFNEVRGVIIASKQADLIDGMTEARGAAVRDILGGMDEADAFRTHRLRAPGQAAVRQALRELDDLEHWGIDDYITNIERGSYRVVTPDGTTVAVAETRVGAKEKALKYGRDHPGTTRLTITDEFSSSAEFPTKLTRGQYFRMAQRAATALGSDVREIQRMLRAEGSPIVVVKPPSKFAGPMQRRYGILEGEADIFDALPAYAYSVRKKLALDPVLKQARTDLPKLPTNTQKQVEDLIGDVRGRYSLADQIADYVLAPLGNKPFAVSRGVGVARTVAAALKLGYRPVSALVNRLGGLQHTWTKTGTRHWLEARRFMHTPEFHEIWLRNADYVGAHAQAFTEAGHADVPWYHPLSMFQFAERVNRPEAFAAFYKYAQRELGMDGPASEAYARKATRFAQFTYTVGSLPRLLRSPPGRLIGQFKAYLVKEMEFVSSLRGFEIPRYLSAFAALGGPRAFIYFLRSLPVLGSIGALWALEDWLNRKAPRASRGAPGFAGIDMTAAVTPQLPSRQEDWMGPALSDAMRLWTDVLRPALQGERRDFSDLKDWGTKLAPTVAYWAKMVEALGDKQGWITDERGRLLYKPGAGGKVALALGAKPLEQSVAEVNRAYLAHINAVALKNRARLIDQILNALDKGDGATLDKLIKDAADYGIDTDAIRNAAKQREREPDERLRRRLLKSVRVQEADRLANPPKP